MNKNQEHWEKVYLEKQPIEVSWYEPMPEVSLNLIRGLHLDKDAAIIDIGGGDSFLAEFLVSEGYNNVTVVDISSNALERARQRMCEKADEVTWIVADASEFKADRQYDLWHDRATFHFFTDSEKREKYLQQLRQAVKPGGFVILGTFSENGPTKCSGLEINQYSVGDMQQLFTEDFNVLSGANVDHKTPSGAVQNFTFCSFQRKKQ